MKTKSTISVFMAGFMGLTCAAQTPLDIAPEHLTAYWPMDQELNDASGHGHHPSVVQGVHGTHNRFSMPNQAQMFNGTDGMIEIPSAAVFNHLPITIAAWFKPNDVPAPGMGSQIIGKYIDASWNGWFMRYNTENNMIVPGYLVGAPALGCDAVIDGYGCGAGLNQPNDSSWAESWHHVAFVVDETEGKLYMDGQLWASQTWAGVPAPVTSTTTLRIGQKHGSFNGFNGAIDDLAIWTTALNAEEIASLGTYTNEGCMDPEACNYDANANVAANDGCIYPVVAGDCFDGATICGPNTLWNPALQICVAADGCGCSGDLNLDGAIGIVDLLSLLSTYGMECPPAGCTWPQATNYNSEALVDDGSCIFPMCENPSFPGEPCDDGDPMTHASVWDSTGCNCIGLPNVDPSGTGPCEGLTSVTYHDAIYNLVEIGNQCWFRENLKTATYANGDSIPSGLSDDEWGETIIGAFSIYGDNETNLETYGRLYNWHAVADARSLCPNGWYVPSNADWTELTTLFGGLNTAGLHLKSSAYDTPPWSGQNTSGFTGRGGGRRYQNGSYSGLTGDGFWWSSTPNLADLESAHYRLLNYANSVHQGAYSMNTGFSVRCIRGCMDYDGDGICNQDEISGCMDETACNYSAASTDDDGSCIPSQEDGSSCDDEDDNTFNDIWNVETCTCDGTPAVAEDGSGPCEGVGTVTYHGHDYQLVEIGNQCWFRENLKTPIYANGDSISSGLNNAEWSSTNSGATAVHGENASNLETHGRLYNWHAVDDARGVCPSGWHVPTDGEWMSLEMELGMSEVAANNIGWRGTDQGTQMKTTYGWYDGGHGTNSSGFTGLPGGNRASNGYFFNIGSNEYWWSSSPNGSNSWGRNLSSNLEIVVRNGFSRQNGFSVRCVRDAD